jgi:aromatic ring hydroxylase
MVDTLLANVHKQNVTRFPYEIARLAQDIAGGLLVTLPSDKDLKSPETGRWLEKYCKGRADIPTEHRMRILRHHQSTAILGCQEGSQRTLVDEFRQLLFVQADPGHSIQPF